MEDVPKTIGELRQRLARMGNPWTVDPRLSDNDALPDYPRGGQPEEEIPEEHRLTPLAASSDVWSLLAAEPPTNPFLRRRWVEVGLLSKDEVGELALEKGEEEGGAP
jgi:hypothetical protein